MFLGWYYDEDLTAAAGGSDKITKNTSLYAKFASGVTSLEELDTPNYMTVVDVETSFTFKVKAASAAAVESGLTIKNITANNKEMAYTVSGGSSPFIVTATYSPGETYKAELAEDSNTLFVYNGEQPESIRILNFIIKMDEVLGLGLSDEIKYIPKTDISDITGNTFDGLFNLSIRSGSLSSGEAGGSGTFNYSGGGVAVGDTVAIYSGTRPDQRDLDTTGGSEDGDVAYVNITEVNGSTYSYSSADSKDVLFTPDVLPIPENADTDGNPSNNSVTVASSVVDFSDDKYSSMNLDSQTTVDKGDFIAFYAGAFGGGAGNASYGKITGVVISGDDYIIGYVEVSQDEVYAAMDVYHTRNEEIELTDAQIAKIEKDMESQAIASGFIDDAAKYLTALAMNTGGFKELSGDLDLKSLSVTTSGAYAYGGDGVSVLAGGRTKITKKEVQAMVAAGKVLQHFDGSSGVRAELALTFTVEISPSAGSDNKIEITVQAIFEQEVLLSVNVKGGAVWKKAWIFPYIYDYQLNANFDVGTFTGIGITATAKTAGADDTIGYDWKPASGSKAEQKIINIGQQIAELMEEKELFLGEKLVDENGEEVEWSGTNGGSLAEKYAAMLEEADDSWIELFRKEIFSIEGSVDPFHILVFGISADFVVSANMYVTMGMTFEYGNAKRYNYSLMLFHKKTTNETIDLEPAHYQFDFYVMGTLGVRAGVELEVAVGLFSLRLDSIGITAEVGAYAQLWGYFYYHYRWEKGTGGAPDTRESSSSGAMLIEIGIYLKITFKAQLFSSKKLTYQPTLLDKRWPLLTIGSVENVFDYNYGQEETPSFDVKSVRTFTLPTSLFEMKYMDMQTGEIYGGEDADDEHPAKNCDDGTESRFIITFSNDAFSYNPTTNTVTVTPGANSMKETGEMNIIWKNGTLAFTSKSISRSINLLWEDPASGRYISFDSVGGSPVGMIFEKDGAAISRPADPVKQGYNFAGWYSDKNYSNAFAFPAVMPNYPEPAKGITVYAKWTPALNTYKVEHYFQELDGQYILDAGRTRLIKDKKTGEDTGAVADSVPGYQAKPVSQAIVAANGSTVVKIYYERNKYTLKFTYGEFSGEDNHDIVYTYKYGADIYAPRLALGGYIFDGWDSPISNTMPAGNVTYSAKWKADPNTPYRVEHYFQNVSSDGYTYMSSESKTGETSSSVSVANLAKSSDGMTFKQATVGGKVENSAAIRADGTLVIKLYYDRNTADVIFDSKGGSEVAKLTGIRYGTAVNRPDDPTKAGYSFGGWYKDEACSDGNAFDFSLDKMTGGNLTLYAKWVAGSYRVTFDANGGSGTTLPQNFTFGVEQALTANGFVRPGYTFGGWNTKADGTGEAYDGGALVMNLTTGSDINLYAQWTLNSYAVKFHANDGTEASSEQSFNYNETKALASNSFVRPGHTFTGWAESADGAVKYSDGQNVKNLSAENGAIVHLYAKWTANTYTVTFSGNGAGVTGAMTDQSFVYDEAAKALKANSFARAGYTFAGWNTKAAGSGKSYADGEAVSNLAAGGNFVLYAMWTANAYTVTLDDQGGDDGSGSVPAVYGSGLATVTVPSRAGYNFGGYFDGKNGTGTRYYTADGMGAVSWNKASDATLYAHWIQGTFTIILYANGGIVFPESKQVTFGGTYGELPLPSRTGYTFLGWFTDITEGTKVDSGTAVDIVEDQLLYAHWSANPYKVIFNGNGADVAGTMADQSFVYDEATKALSANNFTRTGYTFDGWATTAAGSKVYNDKESVGNLMTVKEGQYNLYAVWKANNYIVRFNGNTNTGGSMSNQSFTYGVSGALNANAFVKTGYTFAGWSTSAEGEVAYSNSQSVVNLSLNNGAVMDLYAKWTAGTGIQYKVKHWQQNVEDNNYTEAVGSVQTLTGTAGSATAAAANTYTGFTAKAITQGVIEGDGSTVVNVYYDRDRHNAVWNTVGGTAIANVSYRFEQPIATPAAPTKEGYDFTGWTWSGTGVPVKVIPASVKMGTADITFTANWSAVSYTVTFNSNGGSPVDSQTIGYKGKAVRPDDPAKAGHSFGGWYKDETCTTLYDFAAAVTGNLTLYAKWTILGYTITFNPMGGGAVPAQGVDHGNKAILPDPAPVKAGFDLDGWYIDEAYSQSYDFNAPVTESLTLYAKWTKVILTVAFDSKGGSDVANQSVDYNGKATLPAPAPTRTGYIFGGWFTDDSFAAETEYDFGAAVTGNLTLYAKWSAIGYSVVFNKNSVEATGDMDAQSFAYDESKALTANGFTWTGYTFNGWNTKADGTGNDYANEETVINLWESGVSVNLYAMWKANNYTIKFNGNGSTGGSMTDQIFTYDTAQNLSANGFTKTGHSFNGWNMAADGNGTAYAPGAELLNLLIEDGDSVTLYAQWSKGQYTITFKSDSNTTWHTITQDYGTAVTAPANPTKAGYNFDGWSSSVPTSMPAENLTLTAKWKIVNYIITYNLNGGTNAEGNPATYTVESGLTLNRPTRAGEYTFTGWTGTGLTEKTKDVTVEAGSTGNRSYTANWEDKLYEVKVIGKDGYEYSLEGKKWERITFPATLDGSTVLEWYEDAEFKTRIVGFYEVQGTGNETIYARLYSSARPCLIENEDDLKLLRDKVNYGPEAWRNGHFKLGRMDGAEIAPVTLRLYGWQDGIGISSSTGGTPFKGTFDGNKDAGCKIIFGTDNSSGSEKYSYRSLFDYVGTGGTVKNVNVEGNFYTVVSGFGGVVGKNEGAVDNCNFKGIIHSVWSESNTVGGIVGNNVGTVSDCTLGEGTIINAVNPKGVSFVGGIAGKNSGTLAGGAAITGVTITGGDNTGGIVGENIGAVSGWTLIDSLIIGHVSSINGGKIGGIAGAHNSKSITDCKLVDSSVMNKYDGNPGGIYIGGIAGSIGEFGRNSATLSDCSVSGKRSDMDYTLSGGSRIGGIAGYISFDAAITGGEKNTVSDVSLHSTWAESYVGGVVGYMNTGTISEWTVKNTQIKGAQYLGGIAGSVTVNANSNYGLAREISNCNTESTVTIMVQAAYVNDAGTIIGNASSFSPSPGLGWITNCTGNAVIETY